MQTLHHSRNTVHLRLSTKETRTSLPVSVTWKPVSESIYNFSFLSSYLRRLQEAQAAANGANQMEERSDPEPSSVSPPPTVSSPAQGVVSPTIGSQSPLLLDPSVPVIPNPPSRYPIAADTFHPHYPPSPTASYNGSGSMDASPN